ncbi:hypothetical protein NC651_005179 [Populus alba x Populus x berolinensis]|nr:hypothetical protein NC651_005179 [Populus alba x Populus x berolinensis]
MVDPVPTGFKFAGASREVGQQANGLMLSDRSAMDQFPENALAVLRSVGELMGKCENCDPKTRRKALVVSKKSTGKSIKVLTRKSRQEKKQGPDTEKRRGLYSPGIHLL